MTTIQTSHQYRCDLNQGPSEVTLKTPIMHQDALGDVFRVSVWRGNKVVDLTGMTVRGYLYFASTRQTLLLEGSITDGCACVTMTSECYAIPGYASLVVQVQDGNIRHSLLKVNLCITHTGSEIVIDPDDILPTLAELLGQISVMEQTTAEAREAAAAADAARESIQGDLAALAEKIGECLKIDNTNTKTLTSGTDFNDITAPGNYVVPNMDVAAAIMNCPSMMGGSLIVMYPIKTDERIVQYYISSINRTRIYFRYYNGSSWTEWDRLASAVDVREITDQLAEEVSDLNSDAVFAFEIGTLNYNTGKDYASTTRLRTKHYISKNITSLSMRDGGLAAYIYDSTETPLGYWKNSGLSAKKDNPTFCKWLDVSLIRKVYPDCKIRLVLSKDDESEIDTSFGGNCKSYSNEIVPEGVLYNSDYFNGWEMSSLSVNSGEPLETPVKNRIRSIPISMDNGIEIHSKTLVFAVYVYHHLYDGEGMVFDGIWDQERLALTTGNIIYNQYVDVNEIKSCLPDDGYLRYMRIVAREIDDSNDIDVSRGDQIYLHFSERSCEWRNGTYRYDNGSVLNWNLRINTSNYVDPFVQSATSEELELACYVYDRHNTYVGWWDFTTERLLKSSSLKTSPIVNFARIRSLLVDTYPNCKFKLVAKHSDGSAISPVEGDKVNFNYGAPTSNKEINILFVGNSFTQDENAYVPALLKEALPSLNFKIGILFHANGSLQNHYDHMANQTPYTRFSVYTSGSDAWSNQDDVLLETALARFDWDIVVFQQAQSAGTTYESCQPYLNDLIDGYTNRLGHNVRFMWQLPHARVSYDGKTHEELFAAMATQAQDVLEKTIVYGLFPSGTAIENARTTILDAIGEKSHLVYDNTAHLQEGLPCLIAAYANVLVIAELVGENRIGVMGSQIMPDQDWVVAQNPPNQHGTSVGATEENRMLAAKCAIMAYKRPYVVTDCSEFNPA